MDVTPKPGSPRNIPFTERSMRTFIKRNDSTRPHSIPKRIHPIVRTEKNAVISQPPNSPLVRITRHFTIFWNGFQTTEEPDSSLFRLTCRRSEIAAKISAYNAMIHVPSHVPKSTNRRVVCHIRYAGQRRRITFSPR